MTQLATTGTELAHRTTGTELAAGQTRQFVTVYVMNQQFGIPVLDVRDIVIPEKITNIPLAPREIAGLMNLRGRIVTVVDVGIRLGIRSEPKAPPWTGVTIEYGGEAYSLLVDSVGEVADLPEDLLERVPQTLDPNVRAVTDGVYRLDGGLLLVLSIDRLMEFTD